MPPVYTEPREWLDADRVDAFESCFECALGGAGYKPLWRPGGLCGTAEAVVAVEDGVRLDYRTGWETGFLTGASPEIALAGRYHGLDTVDYLDVTVDNPDERDKAFAGILIQTLRGRRYYLPVAQGEERRLFAPLAGRRTRRGIPGGSAGLLRLLSRAGAQGAGGCVRHDGHGTGVYG